MRSLSWYTEVAAFFEIPEHVVIAAVARPGDDSAESKQARVEIFERFMSPQARTLYDRVAESEPEAITDEERSILWKQYVFLCLTGDRRGFEKIPFYDLLIECLLEPLIQTRSTVSILDYGCGASVFTRLLAEEFGERVELITADVCSYAVEYTQARNRIHSPRSIAVLLEDVFAVPRFENLDFILADTVFEHLPNAGEQIQGLIDALRPGGILVENYAGCSSHAPHKSDTFSAYQGRDANLERLHGQLELLYGKLPPKVDGVYEEDGSNRYWIRPGGPDDLDARVRENLQGLDRFDRRVKRLVRRLWKSRGPLVRYQV